MRTSKAARRHKRAKQKEPSVMPGVCSECGCTATTACWHDELGPCGWADQEQTLCTHCAYNLADVVRFGDLPVPL